MSEKSEFGVGGSQSGFQPIDGEWLESLGMIERETDAYWDAYNSDLHFVFVFGNWDVFVKDDNEDSVLIGTVETRVDVLQLLHSLGYEV